MSTIDQQFVEYVIKSLVGHPDAVSVVRSVDEKGVLLELTVDPEDLGRVIGKRGATAQSVRTLLRALGTKNEARYNLKIVDNGEPRPSTTTSSDDGATDDSWSSSAPAASSSTTKDGDDDLFGSSKSPANNSDVISKTRAELADLDDLDL